MDQQTREDFAEMLVAWLTDAMVLPAGAPVPRERLIHPRAEPEIVFVMGSRLAGPGVPAGYLAWPGAGSAPVSIALVTAAVRPETPSLAQARSRCVFTVASLT